MPAAGVDAFSMVLVRIFSRMNKILPLIRLLLRDEFKLVSADSVNLLLLCLFNGSAFVTSLSLSFSFVFRCNELGFLPQTYLLLFRRFQSIRSSPYDTLYFLLAPFFSLVKGSVLRGNSVVSKMNSYYTHMIGTAFLQKMLSDLLVEVVSTQMSNNRVSYPLYPR